MRTIKPILAMAFRLGLTAGEILFAPATITFLAVSKAETKAGG
jgi:hypothetical protein